MIPSPFISIDSQYTVQSPHQLNEYFSGSELEEASKNCEFATRLGMMLRCVSTQRCCNIARLTKNMHLGKQSLIRLGGEV